MELANKLGVDDRFLTDLTERADLTRIVGIGPAYAELLSKAGIRSAGVLAAATPAGLLDTLTKTAATFAIKKVPTEPDLTHWVAEAKKTPDLVTWSTVCGLAARRSSLPQTIGMKVRPALLA